MSGATADLGLIGLAVMGQNIILNMADNGFTICAYNRTVSKVDRFLANEAQGKSIIGAHSNEEFVASLKSPRRIMLLVQAGKAVDDWIESLLPLLEEGDIIIDGGNSHFPDSNRRTRYLNTKGIRFVGSGVSGGEEGARYGPSIMPGGNEEAWPFVKDIFQAGKAVDDWIESLLPLLEKGDIIIDGGNSHFPDSNRRTRYLNTKGIRFVGSGVSGGEEGARYGPSIMPGGNEEAWPFVKDIFQAISAKSGGEPCCEWVGDEGAGHYVKMVHNGIEYGDMQLICEAYDIMKRGLGMTSKEIGDTFAKWNGGVLDSFLIEITRDIMYYNDDDGTALVEKILDKAGQKGTGKWTAVNALDHGMPVTLIAEAVLARCLSAIKSERVAASKKLEFKGRANKFEGDREQFLADLEQALYASKIISYAQGFMLMQEAAKEYGWKLNRPSIALMWRGGCIIRSVFLKDITAAYRNNPELENLLFDDFFNKAIHVAQPGWRDVVSKAALLGLPTPAFSTALSWFDGYRTKDLPANLLQAQRDYFGAHTFHIKPECASEKYPEGQDIHVNWTGRGGDISASTYQA